MPGDQVRWVFNKQHHAGHLGLCLYMNIEDKNPRYLVGHLGHDALALVVAVNFAEDSRQSFKVITIIAGHVLGKTWEDLLDVV